MTHMDYVRNCLQDIQASAAKMEAKLYTLNAPFAPTKAFLGSLAGATTMTEDAHTRAFHMSGMIGGVDAPA